MAFGKKKNNNAPETGQTPEQDSVQQKPAVNNAKYNLTKVFKESVWETAKTFLSENKKFIVTQNGEKKYVVMFLDSNDVGGLDKKRAKNNQDKGQLIQQINSGTIKTYMTKDMLMDNAFVIIPDTETIDALDEYGFMTEAPYLLAYITEGANIEVTDDKIQFQDVEAVLLGKKSIEELISGDTVSSGQPVSSSAAADDGDEDDDYDEDDEDDDSEEASLESAPEEDGPAYEEDESPAYEDESPVFEDEDDLLGPMAGEEEESYDNEEDVISEDYDPDADEASDETEVYAEDTESGTKEFIARQFYSDELGLEISEEPFDIQFVQGNVIVPFSEERGEGWLQEYVAEMSRDANSVLQNMHARNLHKMKERYLKLMNLICEKIQSELDIHDENTYYGGLLKDMQDAHLDEMANLDRDIAAKKEELERIWKKQLEDEGNRAAEAAKHAYIQQFGIQHKNEIANLADNMRDEAEIDYRNQRNIIMEKRKAEAASRLDMGITSVLKEVSELYKTTLDEENKEYMKYYDAIMAFLDENRKDEVARIAVLDEQNHQKEEADRIREEYSAKLDGMTAEFNAKQEAFVSDINKLRTEQDARFAETKSSYESRLAEANKQTADIQSKYDELLDRYSNLDKQKDIEYASRINEMNQINQSLQDRFNYVEQVHNHSNKMALFLGIAMIIVGITVGFIIGAFVNIRNESSAERKALEQQMEQQNLQNSGTNNAIIIGGEEYLINLDD